MSSGMDSSILDTYLYEENNLLDQLDEMLVADEKNGDFSTDDVNEIFRIMHTIKGSSAMMEFNSISTIAHHIEDVFFYIRDKGIETLDPEHKKELFNLMFRSEDYLRSEIEKVEQGVPLSTDIDAFSNEINSFLKKISGAAPAQPEASQAAPAASGAAASGAAASGAAASGAAAPGAAAPASLPDDKDAACFFHVFLEEGVGMENLRAYMIVNAVRECEVTFRFYPSDMETDPDTSQKIAENGFFLAFDSSEDASKAEGILKTQNHIRSYELVNVPKAAPPAKAEEKKASVSKPTAPAPASTDTAAGKAAPMLSHAPVKQNLISVNLMKLDSLMDIVGEIVITESMVTSSPELNLLPRDNRDNFMKSARQLRKLTNDLQDIAMSLRMVPISGVFQKMNRIVRDMKQSLGKDVRLTIVGEDTEVDKTIVDNIQDPIMHIVRNSMDHGIEETAQERIAAGKDPQGEIVLSASHGSPEDS